MHQKKNTEIFTSICRGTASHNVYLTENSPKLKTVYSHKTNIKCVMCHFTVRVHTERFAIGVPWTICLLSVPGKKAAIYPSINGHLICLYGEVHHSQTAFLAGKFKIFTTWQHKSARFAIKEHPGFGWRRKKGLFSNTRILILDLTNFNYVSPKIFCQKERLIKTFFRLELLWEIRALTL